MMPELPGLMDAKGRSVNVFAQEVMAELIEAVDEIVTRACRVRLFLGKAARLHIRCGRQ